MTLVVAAVALIGCTGELIPLDPQPGPGPDADPDPGADAGSADPAARTFFDTNVQPLFILVRPLGACTGCHQDLDPINGPDFLGTTPLDNYDMLIGDQRLMTGDPATSLLVTKGLHSGDAFTPIEISTINQWILLEAAQ